jgi:FSR family fosmidomycin resistance protein-like MFS transporter
MATLPLGVAMAQELAPKGKSMVSSLMMGLALGVGGIMSPIVGKLADIYTVKAVLAWLPVVPLLSMLLVMRLPNIGGANRSNA